MHKHEAIISIEESRLAARQVTAKARAMISRVRALGNELDIDNAQKQRLTELEQLVEDDDERVD